MKEYLGDNTPTTVDEDIVNTGMEMDSDCTFYDAINNIVNSYDFPKLNKQKEKLYFC